MKRALAFVGGAFAACASVADLATGFVRPPANCRPEVWFHCGGTYSEDGICRDLKAMGEMGLGRAWVIMPGIGPGVNPAVPLSEKWFGYFDRMIAEGRKNGVELGFHNCPGWSSSGGPWIAPENSMKRVVASEKDLAPGEAAGKLPMPQVNRGFYRELAVKACAVRPMPKAVVEPAFAADGKGLEIPLTKVGEKGYAVTWRFEREFRPTAVTLRFLQPHLDLFGEIEGSADGVNWRKLGKLDLHFIMNMPKAPKIVELRSESEVRQVRVTFRPAPVPEWQGGKVKDIVLDSAAFATAQMFADADLKSSGDKRYAYVPPKDRAKAGPAKGEWLDLTDRLRADGTLDWTATTGSSWKVIRLGYTSTGKCNAPCMKEVSGLECDKLSPSGLAAHWPNMPARLLSRPNAAGEVTGTYVDSWEVGGQNWTEDFAAQFVRRRGYDLSPYLPLFAGYTVGTPAETARALFDIQLTVGELIRENYYRRLAELCHASGIQCAFQGYGGPFDPVKCIREADSPEGEFWLGRGTEYGGTLRLASSAAHLTGKHGASAESFTTDFAEGRFSITPDILLRYADCAYAQGITRLKLHSWLHQPFGDVKPGYSLWRHGSMFGRNLTWAKEMPLVIGALSRSEYLLVQGRSANEYFAFAGDSSPAASLDKGDRNFEAFAAGYNYDLGCVEDVERFRGGEYRAYFTGFDLYPRLATLKAWRRLAERGAKLFGPRPKGTPSLADDESEWRRERGRLWDGGLVTEAKSVLEGLRQLGIRRQVEGEGDFRALRRRLDDGDVYFVLNGSEKNTLDAELAFETEAPVARMFDALSGEVYALDSKNVGGGRRVVRVKLAPERSTFIVFGREGAAKPMLPQDVRELTEVAGPWKVSFNGPGAPKETVEFKTLASWSDSADERIRYFSGRAVYRAEVAVSEPGAFMLDLGEVREIASLKVNGCDLGTRVRSPYRFTIPAELAAGGKLKLEIEVVNNWPNRMIGDAIARKRGVSEPRSKGLSVPDWVAEGRADSGTGIYTWNNHPPLWTPEDHSVPSGLLGPVKLLK